MLNYLKRTWKNKIAAVAMTAAGILTVCIDNDATFLVLALIFAIPLFFAKENFIERGE